MGKTTKAPALDPEDRYLVPGLVRGLEVLKGFTPERPELSLTEIAEAIGTTRSAAFRAVYTLTKLGFLLHDGAARTYRLGPAILSLGYGYLASRALVEVAQPELERLRDETDWSAHLGVRDGRTVLYLLRVPSRMSMGSIVHVGSRIPASGTSMGRVLLADLDEETLVRLYRDARFDRAPPSTPQSLADLVAQWRGDQRAETVVQMGRFETGIAAVAAPVRDMSGAVVAAINATHAIGGPLGAVPDAALRDRVRAAAERITRQLGAG